MYWVYHSENMRTQIKLSLYKSNLDYPSTRSPTSIDWLMTNTQKTVQAGSRKKRRGLSLQINLYCKGMCKHHTMLPTCRRQSRKELGRLQNEYGFKGAIMLGDINIFKPVMSRMMPFHTFYPGPKQKGLRKPSTIPLAVIQNLRVMRNAQYLSGTNTVGHSQTTVQKLQVSFKLHSSTNALCTQGCATIG